MKRERALRQLKALRKHGQQMRLAAEEWNEPWKTLISTILSARTRDEMTIPVAARLFQRYPSVKQLAGARLPEVMKIIRPLNFYKNKSKNIIRCCQQLVELYHSVPPHDARQLMELAGVGGKTAHVFLSEMGKDALGVDTHVSYISRSLRWTKHVNPDKIQKDLEKLFPQSQWKHVNPVLVRFGKTYTSRRKKDALLKDIRTIE
jgi:endonuclease-3